MKSKRSSESVRVRRELAQLLRRLRAIRRDKLSREQLAERVNVALSEAWSTRRRDTAADAGSVDDFGAAALTHVDNRFASRIDPVRERETLSAECP